MMKSMTGYGKGSCEREGRTLSVELKSVNNRFLDLNCKLPRNFLFLEDRLRKVLQRELVRGRVDVFLTYEDKRELPREVQVDLRLCRGYADAAARAAEACGIPNDLTVSGLFRLPEVIRPAAPEEDPEELTALLDGALAEAVAALDRMRENEGRALCADLTARFATVRSLVEGIRARAPQVAEDLGARLKARVCEILDGVEVDEARLLNEVTFYADRVNIDEELPRLDSHIAQGLALLADGQPQGRKLDFLIQEFNREANTICSKSNDQAVTAQALELKSEIEKIREQVQNVL